MGDLTNKQISASYDGLIKTSDEQPIDGNLKTLQDGVGNNLPIEVSTTGVNFTGTVSGIPGGTDTTYDLGVITSQGPAAQPAATIQLIGSDATTDSVQLISGENVLIQRIGTSLYISAADAVNNLNNLTGGLTLIGGTGINVTTDGAQNITIKYGS